MQEVFELYNIVTPKGGISFQENTLNMVCKPVIAVDGMSCKTGKKQEQEIIWVKFVIFAVLSLIKMCLNFWGGGGFPLNLKPRNCKEKIALNNS